jgi:hypothetical protein
MSLESELKQYRKIQAYIALKQDCAALIQAAEADPTRRAYLRGLYDEARASGRALGLLISGMEGAEVKDLFDALKQRLTELGVIQ